MVNVGKYTIHGSYEIDKTYTQHEIFGNSLRKKITIDK